MHCSHAPNRTCFGDGLNNYMKLNLSEKEREYFRKAGRKGGRKGGKARMAQLTDEQRRELAQRAGKRSAEVRRAAKERV